jgi:hypothetical protein
MRTGSDVRMALLSGLVACLIVVAIVQNAWYWPQLPQRVATHFGIDGQPNAWTLDLVGFPPGASGGVVTALRTVFDFLGT